MLRGIAADGVTQIGAVDSIATVNFLLLNDTAQMESDFYGPNHQSSGQLVFGIGATSATINVEVIDDSEPEVEESFLVRISLKQCIHKDRLNQQQQKPPVSA